MSLTSPNNIMLFFNNNFPLLFNTENLQDMLYIILFKI